MTSRVDIFTPAMNDSRNTNPVDQIIPPSVPEDATQAAVSTGISSGASKLRKTTESSYLDLHPSEILSEQVLDMDNMGCGVGPFPADIWATIASELLDSPADLANLSQCCKYLARGKLVSGGLEGICGGVRSVGITMPAKPIPFKIAHAPLVLSGGWKIGHLSLHGLEDWQDLPTCKSVFLANELVVLAADELKDQFIIQAPLLEKIACRTLVLVPALAHLVAPNAKELEIAVSHCSGAILDAVANDDYYRYIEEYLPNLERMTVPTARVVPMTAIAKLTSLYIRIQDVYDKRLFEQFNLPNLSRLQVAVPTGTTYLNISADKMPGLRRLLVGKHKQRLSVRLIGSFASLSAIEVGVQSLTLELPRDIGIGLTTVEITGLLGQRIKTITATACTLKFSAAEFSEGLLNLVDFKNKARLHPASDPASDPDFLKRMITDGPLVIKQ